jgi:hypothetical protein
MFYWPSVFGKTGLHKVMHVLLGNLRTGRQDVKSSIPVTVQTAWEIFGAKKNLRLWIGMRLFKI